MNTTATWYRMGSVQSGGYAGCVGYDGGAVVGRFAFTTPDHGAASLRFQTSTLEVAGSTTVATGDPGRFRFDLTTSADAHISTAGSAGYPIDVSWEGERGSINNSEGQQAFRLQPNTTYYLWIFPCDTGYNLWKITGVSVTLSGSYGNPAVPGASGGYFGESLGITLSGGSTGALYTVTAACAGRTETLQQKGSGTVLSWKPAVSVYGPLVTDADRATAVITVQTWYGSTLAGSRSISVTLCFRASELRPVPQSGWYSHAPYNADKGAGIDRYIQGISRAEIRFDGGRITTKYGASITGYTVSGGGASTTVSPYRTGVLTGSGTVTVTVRDSRGFTSSESFSVTPLAYQTPAFTDVTIERCDESGAAEEGGPSLALQATAAFSALDGENSASMKWWLRTAAGSFGAVSALSEGQRQIVPGLDPDLNYEVKLEITDAVGNSGTLLRQLPGRKWAMKLLPGGTGAAFGMAPQGERQLEIPPDWEIRRGQERYVPLAESGESGIWRWRKWADGSFELLGAATVTADVDRSWGALYYATLLSGESYPFPIAAIDFAAAVIADMYCFAMGNLGGSLTDTGSVYALSPVQRPGTSLPLRLLIRGRWR